MAEQTQQENPFLTNSLQLSWAEHRMLSLTIYLMFLSALFWFLFCIISLITKFCLKPEIREETIYRRLTSTLLQQLDNSEFLLSNSESGSSEEHKNSQSEDGSRHDSMVTFPLWSRKKRYDQLVEEHSSDSERRQTRKDKEMISYPTNFIRNQNSEDKYRIQKKGPDVLATTFTFKVEKHQGLKFLFAWIAMLLLTFSILPLVSIGWLGLTFGIFLISAFMLTQFIAIIYQNNKYIFSTRFAQTNLSYYIQILHKNALSFDDMADFQSGEFYLRKVLATIKYYSENHRFLFFISLIGIVLFSIGAPLLVDEGCLSKHEEVNSNTCKSKECFPIVNYQLITNDQSEIRLQQEAEKVYSHFDQNEEFNSQRRIYKAQLNNLEPGSTYQFSIYYNQTGYLSGKNSNNLETFKMHYMLEENQIDLALISGYLAFDYGQLTCYHLWDQFLEYWQSNFVDHNNAMIPSIVAASKSEIGYQPFSLSDPSKLKDNIFMTFFPFTMNQPYARLYYHHTIQMAFE
ncbi:UNKNOWN [Stylonychia lemnae]|uniref:Uncharacterized protein n=1 Tax=Stylonychia lemnae TaxID=5949 RepID=A0A078AXP9_STYLE|nr:UNKNOWN [Stylonychia lemnae]|eukprot:CDW86929.1 UNKNOWN [Stylonychia lemnae]